MNPLYILLAFCPNCSEDDTIEVLRTAAEKVLQDPSDYEGWIGVCNYCGSFIPGELTDEGVVFDWGPDANGY